MCSYRRSQTAGVYIHLHHYIIGFLVALLAEFNHPISLVLLAAGETRETAGTCRLGLTQFGLWTHGPVRQSPLRWKPFGTTMFEGSFEDVTLLDPLGYV